MPSRRSILRYLALAAAGTIPGCSALWPTRKPMPAFDYSVEEGPRDRLLIFLPGIDDSAADFSRRGFVDAVRRRCPGVDMIAADARYSYYARRNVVTRLHDDVVAPALERGYRDVWLVGVSMGALGSFLYARDYPDQVGGLVWIAPYLGEERIVEDVAAAGGLAAWSPEQSRVRGYQHDYWAWLKGYVSSQARRPPLYLAYGEGDRYAQAQRLLAGALPDRRVLTVPGGHQWETWQRLWELALERWPLSGAAPGRTADSTDG